jgi:cation:H+ antiporter
VVGVVGIAIMGTVLAPTATIGPVSPASILIVLLWILGIIGLSRSRRTRSWKVVNAGAPDPRSTTETDQTSGQSPPPEGRAADKPIRATLLLFGLASIVTLVAGVVLEQSGNALATRLNVNGAIFGATVLAAITALPEISTGVAAVRMGQVGLAMGDIFGGNAIQVTLFLLADLLAGKAVLPTASPESVWLASLGIVVTAIYLNGLMTRPEKKIMGVGPDSAAVAVAYGLGVLGLLFLR